MGHNSHVHIMYLLIFFQDVKM